MKRHVTHLFTALCALACLVMVAGTASAADRLKVGFVYVSPIGDAGWTFQHDLGRREMEKNLAGRVETRYVEKVPEGPEAERVIRDLAKSGYDLIFTTSFGYMNPTLKVAKMFPGKYFEHATGYKLAKNVGTYMCRFYEGRYLSGIIAGRMSRTNQLGYVAAFPIPEVIRGINAFTLGARSVNPEARVKVIWVNSWFDPGKEREAAETLISQGADVITHHTDSTAPVLTAEEKGVYAIAYHSDMSKYGPRAQLTAVMHLYGKFYTDTARAVLNHTWKPKAVWSGIREGSIRLAPISPVVPEEVVALVEKTTKSIADGSFHPFHGPIRDQAGKVVVADGKTMSDRELLQMNYYVDGVLGSIPR
ncbi:BMP family ABC transporter substrate-binding protein [Thermodesulfobacteriota bacterium B35]